MNNDNDNGRRVAPALNIRDIMDQTRVEADKRVTHACECRKNVCPGIGVGQLVTLGDVQLYANGTCFSLEWDSMIIDLMDWLARCEQAVKEGAL